MLFLYNTLTRRGEEFQPQEPGRVRMYVCGPNLYGPCHVGHAFSYIAFDVLRRYLEFRGFDVIHVQNFTDIEDRIIETARSQGKTVSELAENYISRFFRETDALHIKRAHYYPRATEFIPRMIEMIQSLLANGSAYALDGDVYFRVRRFPAYGRLSHRSPDEMMSGARIEIDPRKEDPLDFALWKGAKPGEPSWDSPWGPGRPGWHIECSAMSTVLLGETIDIHGGGQDLVFPHHENEIAQSEAYTGKAPFVRFWLHNGLLRPSPEEDKMTRHLANFVSCQEALQKYSPDALRLFMLSSHYRTALTWSEEAVAAAESGVERLKVALRPAYGGAGEAIGLPETAKKARDAFLAAMDDDLNTPQAIASIFELARGINQARDEGQGGGSFDEAQAVLRELAEILGLRLEKKVEIDETTRKHLEEQIAQRERLRIEKRWAEADRIRQELAKEGFLLEDTPAGTVWRKI
ncbi:MAG: cysteine--tRNA ligase [Chloroflexi bacterium]|nr:cysteine--tRNA ligase [Chloroflexota bacterium]